MTVTNCKVNHLTNPLGYHMDKTVFSWIVEDAEGKHQTAARIVVRRGIETVSDTGWVELDSLAAPVGVPLLPRTRYHWTVSVRTDAGEEETSEENWFEMGKLDEPWAARWIGCDEGVSRHPVFSKEIVPSKSVAAARLYICGLGLYESAWNGEKIGGEYLTPYCNDYNSWVQYQTYDITERLQSSGTLSVTLGNGWYKGRFGWDSTVTKPYYGDRWRLLAELRLTYADGSEEVIGSDESWTVTRSNITFSNIYDGERRDDTLPAVPPVPAEVVDTPKGQLTARYSTPVTIQEELAVKEVIHMEIKSVFDKEFIHYGKAHEGYDTTCLLNAMKTIPLPESGVAYEPGIPALEATCTYGQLQNTAYGGMPAQLGMCWGRNTKLNCLEYHRDSEFNVGTGDFILLLAKQEEIVDGVLDTSKVKAFRVPAGVLVEVYATTLHYAPCHTNETEGFRVAVVLPRGTNTDKPKLTAECGDSKLLWARNKWLLAHPDSSEAKQGAHVGLVGENIDIKDYS